MVRVVSASEADRLIASAPFPYDHYRAWQDQDDRPQGAYRFVASSTAELRPRAEWNAVGREVYDRVAVERHAATVADLLTLLDATAFVVRPVVPDAAWFLGDNGVAAGKAGELLRQLDGGPDFRTWRGGFVFDRQTQLWLSSFLDYPFVLRTYDLEVVSTDRSLFMHIGHHLAVSYTSTDETLRNDLGRRLAVAGVLEYPDRQ